MTPRDGSVLAFAGIWSVWESAGAARLTFSVLTTAAVGELAEVHDRMPLLLSPERWAEWLGPAEEPAELLAPPDAGLLAGLEIRPVSRAVGDVRNDGPELIAAVAPAGVGTAAGPTLF